ncbi:MAG: hypothetical protein JSR24_10940 [Proteobacteria bacterium]|nr:hypothetical protein [Pseudomonadota bacterium]
MPIRLTVSRPDRLVVGIASDTVSLADLAEFLHQLTEGELHRFRKIIDISAAKPVLSSEELSRFGEGLREALKDTPRGAMAIVADDKANEMARLFAGVTGEGRPAEVFRSIHEARKWLATNAFPR